VNKEHETDISNENENELEMQLNMERAAKICK
jgi:hypothetical protein